MAQQDTSPIKRQIIEFIERNGPSLPTHVATETKQSMLFASAFLSELSSEKKLVLSDMKVGNSPIYFIVGQEPLLEKYSIHLKDKPGEAYKLLREKKFLKDSEQLPAIRVALREIKDFAKPFRFKEEIYWRYLTNSINDFLLEVDKPKKEILGDVPEKKILEESSGEKKNDEETKKDFEKLEKKIDEKLFVDKVREYLKKEKIVILEETDVKKREFLGRARIQSDVGEIEILVIGRDKKNILEKDIEKIMEEVVSKKMLVLFLSTGEIAKKTKDVYREHKNLIKFISI